MLSPVLRELWKLLRTCFVEQSMYKGNLIEDLLSIVEKAERSAMAQNTLSRAPDAGGHNLNYKREALESEQLTQSLGLRPADRDFGLLLVVHPELVGALEPRHHFPNPVNVYQVGAVGPPKKIRV